MEAQEVTLLPVTAQQAPSWGMIWQAVPDDDLLAEVRRLARELARGATFGPGLTKQAIQAATTNTLAQQLEHPVVISWLRRLGARYSCFYRTIRATHRATRNSARISLATAIRPTMIHPFI